MLKLDLSYLEDITGGDAEVIQEMLILFIEDIPQQISEIKEAIQGNNLEEMASHAHKLKPTLQYVGLSEAYEIVKNLEQIGKSGEGKENVKELFQKLERNSEEFMPVLKSHASSLD
ncbi:MAG: Hpt domain-containing protein [Balneola sp.]|nr:MAG: Hpt domain-containing protein [Balneola sp.]